MTSVFSILWKCSFCFHVLCYRFSSYVFYVFMFWMLRFHVLCFMFSCCGFRMFLFVWCSTKRVDTFVWNGTFEGQVFVAKWIRRARGTRSSNPLGQDLGTPDSGGPSKFPPRRVFPGSNGLRLPPIVINQSKRGPKTVEKWPQNSRKRYKISITTFSRSNGIRLPDPLNQSKKRSQNSRKTVEKWPQNRQKWPQNNRKVPHNTVGNSTKP